MKIDLNDLTQAHYDACIDKLGECHYAAPCIIGTLMPEDQRDHFDGLGLTSIDNLINHHREIEMPEGQCQDAIRLQCAFDNADLDELVTVLRKYIPELEA